MALNNDLFKKTLSSTSGLKKKTIKKTKKFSLDERIEPIKKAVGEYIVKLPESVDPSKVECKVVKPKQKVIAKPKQEIIKSDIQGNVEYEMLWPLEKKIIDYIKNQIDPNSNSQYVLVDNKSLLKSMDVSQSALRNALCHMKAYKTLIISKSRNGPSGWRLFEITGLLKA